MVLDGQNLYTVSGIFFLMEISPKESSYWFSHRWKLKYEVWNTLEETSTELNPMVSKLNLFEISNL